ncbi:MAG: hypothetical protein GY940_21320 [bacterium]|nr:hypothetical protein [bacterium]
MKKPVSIIGLFLLITISCAPGNNTPPTTSITTNETPIQEIILTGAVTNAEKAEISGLTWYKDYLILLPQYPHRFKSKKNGRLFAIPKQTILSYLDSSPHPEPIKPKKINLVAPGLKWKFPGYQGFEAIAFHGDRVFLTIEAHLGKKNMMAYLVGGEISPDLSRITLDTDAPLVKIRPQARISNFSNESLIVTKDHVISVYEGNGKNINPSPIAHVFDHQLKEIKTIPFPTIEYRITDASAIDGNGRFWCINYCWPGSWIKLKPAEDGIVKTYGQGPTHSGVRVVERLVEFQYTPSGIKPAHTAPIQLQLAPKARNWEGIVRLGNRGFIIVTDEHPRTILAFVPR